MAQADTNELNAALQVFRPINASCVARLDQETKACVSCVETKCEARQVTILLAIQVEIEIIC